MISIPLILICGALLGYGVAGLAYLAYIATKDYILSVVAHWHRDSCGRHLDEYDVVAVVERYFGLKRK